MNSEQSNIYLLTCVKWFAAVGQLTDLIRGRGEGAAWEKEIIYLNGKLSYLTTQKNQYSSFVMSNLIYIIKILLLNFKISFF